MQPKQVNGGCEVTGCLELAASQEGAWMEGGTDGQMDGWKERVSALAVAAAAGVW